MAATDARLLRKNGKMSGGLDISVLMATYNRAEILRETLEAMTQVDREGIDVEIVVIDNNSSDNTREVVESFAARLPVRYLFEPRPGKNCALNHALDVIHLGKLVAFTDDDVRPRTDWFKAILGVADRWPACDVFGGKVYPVWPEGYRPGWTSNARIGRWGFADHKPADRESLYRPEPCFFPTGANLWVRRRVFKDGRRYDESIGPRPNNRIMGSEASFLLQLKTEGHDIVYSPEAVVAHVIQRCELTEQYMLKRAYTYGKGLPHLRSIGAQPPSRNMLRLLKTVCVILLYVVRYLLSKAHFSRDRRIITGTAAVIGIAYNMEVLRADRKVQASSQR